MYDSPTLQRMGKKVLPKLTPVRVFQLQLWSLLAESWRTPEPAGNTTCLGPPLLGRDPSLQLYSHCPFLSPHSRPWCEKKTPQVSPYFHLWAFPHGAFPTKPLTKSGRATSFQGLMAFPLPGKAIPMQRSCAHVGKTLASQLFPVICSMLCMMEAEVFKVRHNNGKF